MYTLAQILCALLLPAGITVLIGLAAREVLKNPRCCFQQGLGGFLVACVYFVGHAATAQAVDAQLIPPHLGWHWLPWTAAALAVVMLTATPPGFWRWALQAVIAAAGAWVLLLPLPALTAWQIAAWAGACAVTVVGSGLITARGTVTAHTGAGFIAASAIAMAVLLTHSKDLALLVGILPPILLATWVVWRKQPAWGGGLIAVTQLLAWHLTLASTYSDMPWWLAPGYAAILPLGALASRLGRTATQATLWHLGAALVASLVLLAATFFVMSREADESADAASAYGY